MSILITGATGLVGSHLVEKLFLSGHHNINILTRNKFKAALMGGFFCMLISFIFAVLSNSYYETIYFIVFVSNKL